jgi:hypothetical protein
MAETSANGINTSLRSIKLLAIIRGGHIYLTC